MIEDAVLEQVLTAAGEAVAVPEGARQRVLAARDRLLLDPPSAIRRASVDRWFGGAGRAGGDESVVSAAPGGELVGGDDVGDGAPAPRRSAQRTAGAILAATAAAAVLAVVAAVTLAGATHHRPASTAAHSLVAGSAASGGAGYVGGAANQSGSTAGASGTGPAPAASGGPVPATSPDEVPAATTKVVKTATVAETVPHGGLAAAMDRLQGIAVGQGGYTQTSATDSAGAGQPATGSATLRVPVANFTAALDAVEGLGRTTSVSTSGQDVTSQYVDLQARLQSLEDARTQFQQILTDAQTISDILAVEQQISDLQTQIEQLQGQINVMDDQTSYSTITVTLTETANGSSVVPPARPSGLSRAWDHARHSFVAGLEDVVAASGGIAVFVVFAAAAVLVGRLLWTRTRRRLL